jgi:hypothetical protein
MNDAIVTAESCFAAAVTAAHCAPSSTLDAAQRRVSTETGDVTVTSIDICSGSKQPAVFIGLLYFGAIDMIVEKSKRAAASLIQPISITALTTPKTTGGRFLKRPRPPSEGRSAKRPPKRPQPVLAKRPPKRPGPRSGKREPRRLRGRYGTSPKTTPDNDLGVVFENTRGRLGRVVSTKRPTGSFQNDPLAR